MTKQNQILINRNIIQYSVIIFVINVFSISASHSLVDFYKYQLNTSQIGPKLLTMFVVLLLSSVCGVVVYNLVSTQNKMFIICAVLLMADPLFSCSILNFEHVLLLFFTVVLCLYLIVSQCSSLKTLFVAIFVSVAILIYRESAFSHIPIIALVYGFARLSEEGEFNRSTNKRSKKNNTNINKNGIRIRRCFDGLLTVLYLLSMYIGDKLSSNTLNSSIAIYQYGNINSYFYNGTFVFASIPYFSLMVIFMYRYLLVKAKHKHITLNFVFRESKFLWPTIISFGLLVLGFVAFDYVSSITVFNLTILTTIILLFLSDPRTSSKAAEELFATFRKYRYIVCMIFVLWFCFMQYLFKDIQYTVIDDILSVVGSRL